MKTSLPKRLGAAFTHVVFGAALTVALLFPAPRTFAAPAAPTISGPGTSTDTGLTVANKTPAFSWSGVSGATRYGLFISKSPYGSANLIYSKTNLTGSPFTIPSGNLVDGTKYRWQMTSFDSAGTESGVSNTLYFQTPGGAVGPPTISGPGTGTDTGLETANKTPAFSWVGVSGATRYGLFISKSPYGSANLIYSKTDLTGSPFTIPSGNLVDGTKYRWQMTSFNSAGTESGVSNTLYFQTPGGAVGPPTISGPGTSTDTGLETANKTPAFSWVGVSGATRYGLFISKSPYGSANLIYSKTDLTGSPFTIPSGNLVDGTKYRWQMTSFNSAGTESGVSNTLYFQTPGGAVGPPTISGPGTSTDTGLETANKTPAFSWVGVSGATRYGLFISKSPYGSANLIYSKTDLTGSPFTIPSGNLVDGTKYRWQMTSFNSAGTESGVSNTLYFQTPGGAVGPPTISGPGTSTDTGLETANKTPAFSWVGVSGATRYGLFISKSPYGSANLIYSKTDLTGSPFTIPSGNLVDGTKYRWQMTSFNSAGTESGVSNTLYFQTPGGAVGPPTISGPGTSTDTGLETANKTPAFSWVGVSGATRYGLFISKSPYGSANLIYSKTDLTGSPFTIPSGNLVDGTKYRWQMTSFNSAGTESGVSNTLYFQTPGGAVGPPTISGPGTSTDTGLETANKTPAFSWVGVSGATRYGLFISKSPYGSANLIYSKTDLTGSPFTIPSGNLVDGTKYRWQMTSFNSAGTESGVSNTLYFQTPGGAVGPPTISGPGTSTDTGLETANKTPAFSWVGVSGATRYGLFISKSPYGSANLIYSKTDLTGSPFTIPSGNLVDGTKYRWQMTSFNSAGTESGVSNTLYFQTPGGAVGPPTISGPGTSTDTGLETANKTPAFSWVGVSGATRYGLFISKSPYGSANLIYSKTDLTGSPFTIPSGNLVDGTKYRWQMTSFNSAGTESGVSNTLYFQTPGGAVGPPTISGPGTSTDTGLETANKTPAFSWVGVSGATRYGLFISKSPYGSANLIYSKTDLTGSPFTIPSGNLVDGTKYRWQMTSFNSAGTESGVSNTLYFQTPGGAVGPPTISGPGTSTDTGLETANKTPAFSWVGVSGATRYGLFISKSPYGSANLIYSKTDLTGSPFTIPSGNLVDGTKYRWQMTSFNSAGTESGVSNTLYFQTPPQPIDITLSSPNGGEPLQAGDIYTIRWTATGAVERVTRYVLDYSTQSGAAGSYTNFIQIVNAPATSYLWTVPSGLNSNNVRVRIRAWDASANELDVDTSNANFSISAGPLPPPQITITEPVAGATWTAGNNRTIKWTAPDTSPPQISYFIPEVAVDGSTFSPLPQVGSSARSANWLIPSNAVSAQAKVRVKAFNAAGQPLDTEVSGAFNIIAPAVTKPNAVIVTNWDAVSGVPVLFKSDQSTASAAGATITTRRWEFGDGNESSQTNPQHTYAVSTGVKQFTVKLTVTDSLGNTDADSGVITVGARTQSTNTQQGFSPDPVNLATGNYTYEHSDIRLPGVGLPFEFKRFYNSRGGRFDGPPLGPGWTHSLNEHVIENTDGSVSMLRGDGNLETYTVGATGEFLPEAGVHNTLTKTAAGLYLLTSKDEVRREFDATRRLAVVRDRNDNAIQIVYAPDGTIDKFVDTAGRTIEVTSDGAGRIIGLADPLGRIVSFSYDGSGDLVSTTDRRGGVTLFTYDANHQVLTVRDPRGNVFVTNTYDDLQRIVTAQKDALAGETKFEYDFVSRVTTMTDTLGHQSFYRHDERLRVTSVTDARGKTEAFEYDSDNNRVKVTDKRGAATIYAYDAKGNVTGKTDPLGKKTTIQYDPFNRPLLRRDAIGAKTAFAYDARGNLVKTTNPLGFVTRAEYDARGLAVRLIDPLGRITEQAHDASGNLIKVTDALLRDTHYEYDAVGRRTAMVDARSARTTSEYDEEDHLKRSVDPLTHATSSLYDANGNRTEVTDPRGSKTKFTYDVKDRLIKIEDALGNITQHTYDAMDRKVSTIDARSYTTEFAYDATGNLTRVKDARNNETWFSYDANSNRLSVTNALGQTAWTEYDPLNRAVRSGDPLGNMTNTQYDAVDRKVRVTDPLGRNTLFQYDLAGRLLRVTDAAGGAVRFTYDKAGNRLTQTDQRGQTTRYAYDTLNRVLQMREPMGGITTYAYDEVGNRVKKVDANGQETQFFHSLRRTLDRVLYADSTEVNFTYDPARNRTGMTDTLGASSWVFDALSRVTTHTDPFGKALGYGYDAVGNRASLTYPGSKTVTYTYDETNRMTEVKDWDGRATTYAYDPAGRPIGAANPNGTEAALTYDEAGRVIELVHNGPADALIARYAISHDAVGNHRHVEQTEPLQAVPPEEDTTYTYDKDNRLIKAGSVTLDYDANGNTIHRSGDTFGYDATDRLATAEIDGTPRAFGYDGLGNRLVRTVGGVTTRFVVDLNSGLSRILCETDASGNITAYYVHGLNLVSRIAADGSVRYYHGDVRGSTVALTDTAGAVTDKYAYDEFGVALARDGATANPFRYLGRAGIYDEGNDLLHIRARYYSPSLGRFHSKDPFPASDDDGQSLHRYIYAVNNPLRLVDVTGWVSQESSKKWVFAEESVKGLSIDGGIKAVERYIQINFSSAVSGGTLSKATGVISVLVSPGINLYKEWGEYSALETAQRFVVDVTYATPSAALSIYAGPAGVVTGAGYETIRPEVQEWVATELPKLIDQSELLYNLGHGNLLGDIFGF